MKEIILTQNRYAIVDDDDYEILNKYKWYYKTPYAARRVKGIRNKVIMHRVIMGEIPEGLEVDHINGNKLDNRKCNLRVCRSCDNSKNVSKTPGCSSKFKGVSWASARKRWRVEIKSGFNRYRLGSFKSEIEAAIAYNKKAIEVHGEFAKLNEVGNV